MARTLNNCLRRPGDDPLYPRLQMLRGFAPPHLLTGCAREELFSFLSFFVQPEGRFVIFVV